MQYDMLLMFLSLVTMLSRHEVRLSLKNKFHKIGLIHYDKCLPEIPSVTLA